MNIPAPFKAFLQKLVLITIVLLIAGLVLSNYVVPQYAFVGIYVVIFFFALSTGIVYYVYHKIAEADMRKFVRYFMQLSMGKLMVYGLFMAIMFFCFRGKGVALLASAFLCYVSFTILELNAVLKLMRKK